MHVIRIGDENPSTLNRLLAWGVNPSGVAKADGWTPLMEAVTCHRLLSADWLLAHGADPQARNADGERAEDVAQRLNLKDLVYLLHQEDPLPHAWVRNHELFDSCPISYLNSDLLNRRSKAGDTALHLAIGLGRWDEAKALVEEKLMDLDAKNQEGRTALDLLAGIIEPEAEELRSDIQTALASRASKVRKDKEVH